MPSASTYVMEQLGEITGADAGGPQAVSCQPCRQLIEHLQTLCVCV